MTPRRRTTVEEDIGRLLGTGLVILAILLPLSVLGHLIGLTPSASEFWRHTDDGWIGRHYSHVVWGYVITAILGMFTVVYAPIVWGAYRQRGRAEGNQRLVAVLASSVWVAAIILAIALPIGARTRPLGLMPSVVGMTSKAAEQEIHAAGLQFISYPGVDTGWSDLPVPPQCRVISQKPAAGREPDGDVRLRCEIPVPDVKGTHPEEAEKILSEHGLNSNFYTPLYDSYPEPNPDPKCRVRSSTPRGTVALATLIRVNLTCPSRTGY